MAIKLKYYLCDGKKESGGKNKVEQSPYAVKIPALNLRPFSFSIFSIQPSDLKKTFLIGFMIQTVSLQDSQCLFLCSTFTTILTL